MKQLSGSLLQITLAVSIPLFLALTIIAVLSAEMHNNAMREMMALNDQETAHAMALAISEHRRAYGPAGDKDIRELVGQLLTSHDATIVILTDETGRVVYHSDASQIGKGTEQPGVARALNGESGALFTPGGHVVTYMPVKMDDTRWALVIKDPWMVTSSSWLSTPLAAPLLLAILVVLSLIIIGLGVNRILFPLQRLDAQVTSLGWGDFEAIKQPVGGIRAIEGLQQALTRMAAQVNALQQGMHGYIGAVTRAQEEERKRVARELHDDTIQSLVTLRQQTYRIRRLLARETAREPCDTSQTEATLNELQEMIAKTMEDVRRFSHALRPVYLEEAGLVAALEMLARDAGKQTSAQVNLATTGDTRRLPDEVELALYRIVQEALTNALKHAQAAHIHIQIEFNDKGVIACVQDDGIGFTQPTRVSDLVPAGHYGLMGIHERAQLIGAKLVIRSQPGQGTRLEVHKTYS